MALTFDSFGLDRLAGLQVPGGCDDCDAYQTVDARRAPIYRVTVHHDQTCPTYRRLTSPERGS
jgi:hypothetical protein